MDKLLPPPPLASDERFSILANIAAERFAQLDLTALMVYLVDLVDASALPALAEQFHVQGWKVGYLPPMSGRNAS